jgi:hypothetical protein
MGDPILETAPGSKSVELVYFRGRTNVMVWVNNSVTVSYRDTIVATL